MNKSESKYYNTACLMDEALFALLETTDFEYITVKELCKKAGVNRSTFYLHYETLSDLLEECVQYFNDQFLDYVKLPDERIVQRIPTCATDELYFVTPEYLEPYLNFVKERRRLFETVVRKSELLRLDKTYEKLFTHVFDPILDRFGVPEKERRFTMTFYIHGLMAIVSEWLKGGCAEPVGEIIEVMRECVRRPE